MNTLLKIGIGIGTIAIVHRLLQLNKLASNVSISLSKIKISKINLSGVEILSSVVVNNPSNVTANIVNPVVRIWNENNIMLSESKSTGKQYPIAANQQSSINDISLSVPWTNLLPQIGINSISSLINAFSKQGSLAILKAIKSPIFMTVIMQVDGMTIETPKTLLNQ